MTAPRLVLAAHGSAAAGYEDVISSIGRRVVDRRRELQVAGGYLDHCVPLLRDAVQPGDVVVPLLLSRGFHASADIAAHAPGLPVARPLGPDPLLALACADRLAEAGWDGRLPVVLAAAGSSDPDAAADVQVAAEMLSDRVGVPVTAAYLSAATPLLSDVLPAAAVVSYLLAPGRFAAAIAGCGAPIVSAVIGDHPAVAELVLARYDELARGGPA